MSRQYTKRGTIKSYLAEKLPTLKVGKYALPVSFSYRAVQMRLRDLGVLGHRGGNGQVGVIHLKGKCYLHVRRIQEVANNAPTP